MRDVAALGAAHRVHVLTDRHRAESSTCRSRCSSQGSGPKGAARDLRHAQRLAAEASSTTSTTSTADAHVTYHRFTCALLTIPAACPPLRLTHENVLTRLGDHLGHHDVKLEYDDFNRRFHVELQGPEVRVRAARRSDDGVAARRRHLRPRRDRRAVGAARATRASIRRRGSISASGSTPSTHTFPRSCTPRFHAGSWLRLASMVVLIVVIVDRRGRRSRSRSTTGSCICATWCGSRGATSTPSSSAATT